MVSIVCKKYAFYWILAALLVCMSLYYVFMIMRWDGFTTGKERKIWRQKIVDVYKALNVGMTKRQATEIINTHRWPKELQYHEESLLLLNTPIEMGAQNWVLNIEFDKKMKILGIKIRTSDGSKPANSPVDKLSDKENN